MFQYGQIGTAPYGAQVTQENNVVGNDMFSDNSFGYKEEIKGVMESYTRKGVKLNTGDMLNIITDPTEKLNLMSTVTEGFQHSPLTEKEACTQGAFYGNYIERFDQMLDNSLRKVAQEAAVLGYSPIQTYVPFFLKKFWLDNVFKDVLMTEIPKSPIINHAFEKMYAVDHDKNEYELPDSLYDDELSKKLIDLATGININEDPIALTNFKPALNVLNSTYFPGLLDGNKEAELTSDIHICKVIFEDSGGNDHEVPCTIKPDITTHNFVKGNVKYDVKDEDGNVTETLEDELIGNVDFKNGAISLMSKYDKVKSVCLRGKLANRWNWRSLDITRRVEQIQHVMPESGPRLNSAITIEDAADAIATQNVDQIAMNSDFMGKVLADFEDADIKRFLFSSFEAQRNAGIGPHGFPSMIVESDFDAMPYYGFSGRVTDWMKDSREWMERLIMELKQKLNTADIVIIGVCHPNIVHYFQDGINWVFENNTQISGVKLSYNFGVLTSTQDRVHIITTQKMSPEYGMHFIVIPLTQNLITFKHYVYNMVIDRNYLNPVHTLVPNIMCTMRMLTFEVLPVQGRMNVLGRGMSSPRTLVREPANGGTGAGDTGTP